MAKECPNCITPWVKDSADKSRFMKITPIEALHLLDYHNEENRKENKTQQTRIKMDFKRRIDLGLPPFKQTPKTPGFKENGQIADGQNRFRSIVDFQVEEGIEIIMEHNVTLGLPNDCFEEDVPDKQREPKDVLERYGYPNFISLTEAEKPKVIRILERVVYFSTPDARDKGTSKCVRMNTVAELWEMYGDDILNAIDKLKSLHMSRTDLTQTKWRDLEALVVLCERANVPEWRTVIGTLEASPSKDIFKRHLETFTRHLWESKSVNTTGSHIFKGFISAVDRVRDGSYNKEGLFGKGHTEVPVDFIDTIKGIKSKMPSDSIFYIICPNRM